VYLGEEPVYLDTSKLVTRKPILDLLDCDEVFPPIFKTTNGQLVQAAPTVQPISLQLSKPIQLGQQIYRPGTPNSELRKLCTVHCGRNVNKSSAPRAVEEKGLNTDKQSDVTVENKRN